jgi:hypothetical protein
MLGKLAYFREMPFLRFLSVAARGIGLLFSAEGCGNGNG